MKKRIFLYLLPVLLLLAGCNDESETVIPTPPGIEKGYLSMEITIPGNQEAQTYAATEVDECQVDAIDVLGFNTADNKFLFHTQATDIEDASGAVNGNKKRFKVLIPQNSGNIYLLVIANAHNEISTVIANSSLVAGKTLQEASEMILIDQFTTNPLVTSGKWTVRTDHFRPFPMWGRTGNINLSSPSLGIPALALLRGVAKVDVGVNFGTGANINVPQGLGTTFVLKEVYLCNTMRELQVIPDPANVNAAYTSTTAASVPAATLTYNPIQYDVPTTSPNGYMNEIYMAEHIKGSDNSADIPRNPCLIIGGIYNNSGTVTYYRVDFAQVTRNSQGDVISSTFLDVMRNYRYKVNITRVQGAGSATVAQALSALGSNISADIISESEDITNISYDGQYMLGTNNPDNMIISKDAKTGFEVNVKTTHPSGWTATSNVSWLTFQSGTNSLTGPGQKTLKFDVQANPSATTPRIGIITIKAGRIEKQIRVEQKNIGNLDVEYKASWYLMDGIATYRLNIKSAFPWSVKVRSDQFNILKTFTASGAANPTTGTEFRFSLVDDIQDQMLLNKTTTLTFYSPTGDFPDTDVQINGRSDMNNLVYDLAGLYVWKTDQPTGYSWYVYANTPDNHNTTDVPPLGTQQFWPRDFSCAALAASTNKPWRLPTRAELIDIYNAATTGGPATRYGFITTNTTSAYYWSATSNGTTNAYIVLFSGGNQLNTSGKTSTTFSARCVRSK